MSKVRQERTAEQIQQLLSEIFLREISDPRLAGVTIIEVEIDRELQYATVYINALGEELRQEEVMAGLQSASGFLRRTLAGSLGLRNAPILRFQWDPRLRYVEEVDKLLEELDIKPDDTLPTWPPRPRSPRPTSSNRTNSTRSRATKTTAKKSSPARADRGSR